MAAQTLMMQAQAQAQVNANMQAAGAGKYIPPALRNQQSFYSAPQTGILGSAPPQQNGMRQGKWLDLCCLSPEGGDFSVSGTNGTMMEQI